MPAALPGLVGGNDLPIYAPNNLGRPYKIGYIVGLNTCGTFLRRRLLAAAPFATGQKSGSRLIFRLTNHPQYGQSQKISITLKTPPPQ